MSSLADRGSVEDYYPYYCEKDADAFDHAYWKCRCGWRSREFNHPSMASHYADGHRQFGATPDCGRGQCVIVFTDGEVAEVAV